MSTILEQAQQDNLDREDLRRLQKVIGSYGEGKARESELQADYIDEIDCGECGDEYSLFSRWSDNSVILRDKECPCPIDPKLERELIALHHQNKPELMLGMLETDQRLDEMDNFEE